MARPDPLKVGILGSGAWGTALACIAEQAGNPVLLWGRDPILTNEVQLLRENPRLLPGVRLGPGVQVTSDVTAMAEADLLLAVVPTQALRSVLLSVRPWVAEAAPIVICAKGIEQGTGLLPSDIVRELLPQHPPAALSGPSFAMDVGKGLPTAVTLAASSLAESAALAARLATPTFRLYHSDDLVGVEIGGAVKNVLAIACGIAQGSGLGASAAAALMARAFAELLRFGRANGARAETLMGLSGFGDLVLTCGSAQSRNFSYGLALGRGDDVALAGQGRLVEGVMTAPILLTKAQQLGVSMPIVESIAGILQGSIGIGEAIQALLARPAKAEE